MSERKEMTEKVQIIVGSEQERQYVLYSGSRIRFNLIKATERIIKNFVKRRNASGEIVLVENADANIAHMVADWFETTYIKKESVIVEKGEPKNE